MVALATIAVLFFGAIAGGFYLKNKYDDYVTAEPALALHRLRQAFISIAEMEKLVLAVEQAGEADADVDVVRREVAYWLDILFARLSDLETDPFWRTDESVVDFVSAFRGAIEHIDRLIADETIALEELRARFEGWRDQSYSALIEIANEQHRAERSAVGQQRAALRRAIFTAALLLLILVSMLGVTLAMLVRESRAKRDIAKAEASARHIAYHDALTGMPNRAAFYRRANAAIDGGEHVALCVVDLDNFKAINDDLGHPVGDAFLSQVGRRIQEVASESFGFSARLGGDEFAAFFTGPQCETFATAFCRRIMASCASPIFVESNALDVSVSVGVASREGVASIEHASLKTLLSCADKALYRAKIAGKRRFSVFDQDLVQQIQADAALEHDLRNAIAAETLSVAFQPQVDVASRRIVGFEALARWRNGDADIPPGRFIDLAERVGLICPLDELILAKSIAIFSEHAVAHLSQAGLSVNLSAAHFGSLKIVDTVESLLSTHDFPSARLTLEITETVLISDWDRASAVVRALKELGVRLSLDDFGTGYSSLAYLQKLPVDELKIDRSLLHQAERGAGDEGLLSALYSLASALGKSAVAEGVERIEQERLLARSGFRIAQGFYYARPMSADAVRTLIESAAHRGEAPTVDDLRFEDALRQTA